MSTTRGPVCVWDSGSATGCRPVCAEPATLTVTHTGYRGPYVTPLCADHARILPARIWPDTVTVSAPITAGRLSTHHAHR